jgi:uncharacterized membrane protein YphA (DoxX/SURF4 family)
MELDKVSHKKIAIRTFLLVLIMTLIIFFLNSWSNIKLSLDGNTPPFNQWIAYISKLSTLIYLLAFGAYFYYRDWSRQKELIKNQKAIAAKHQSWLDNN